METISVQSLIRHFEEKVYHFEKYEMGRLTGKGPHFPMAVISLGDDATEGCKSVAMHLCEMWPSFANELLFLGMTEGKRCAEYIEYSINDGTAQALPIPNEKIGNRVSSLFGLKGHFQDKSRLLLYYLLDSTHINNSSEFLKWVSIIQNSKSKIIDSSIETLDLLIVLLNENIGERQAVSKQIRNAIFELGENAPFSTLLISNRRSDHVILEDWTQCYKLVANTIALTNNDDAQVAEVLFRAGVYTAAYACEEKPVSKIGHVMIKSLLEHLSKESFGISANLLADKTVISSKLGLSPNRTFLLLDSYAEQSLFSLLPTAEQLDLFPRRDCNDYDITSFSEKDFNELTMGSWDCFLSQIISDATQAVCDNNSIKASWREQYAKELTKTCTIHDLIWLRDHAESVNKFLSDVREPSREDDILSVARTRLKYKLSSSQELITVLFDTIRELGNNSELFLKEWSKLIKSGRSVHDVNDENISAFYSQKAQDFYDHHGEEISESFRRITDMGSLAKLLNGIIDRMIENDPVFSSAFEEEMETRLQSEGTPQNAKTYIRKKLTGDNVPIFFQAQFSFGTPAISCILIKKETQLYFNLEQNLPSTVYYYNTGSSNAAEAVNFYVLSTDKLVSGEA